MYEALLRRAWICPPSALLVRRTAVLDVGGWSEQLTNAEDLDLYLRLARAHQGIDHTDVVTDYRLHRGMKSRSYRKGLEGNLRALSEHPPVGAEPHLLRARQQGERHYQRAYGRKVVLTAWTDSLRSRRNVRDATRDLTRLLLTDLHGVLALVLRSSSRRTRVAWRRRAATWRMRGARLLRPSAPGRRRRGGNNPAG
jgi:hypothetical protein